MNDWQPVETLPIGLTVEAWEVLGSLTLGLQLEESDSGWAFVGPWQPVEGSGVTPSVMEELFSGGFVERGSGSACVPTAYGRGARKRRTLEALRGAIKIVQGSGSPFSTS